MPDKQGIMNYTWIQRIKAAHRNQIPKFFYFFLVSALLVLTTCTEEQVSHREYPRVKTLDVTNISERGATFNAEVYSEGNDPIIEHGFVWGTKSGSLNINQSIKNMLGSFSGTGIYKTDILSLLEVGKVYYVRSFVKTTNHTIYGVEVSFESLGSEGPIITSFEPKVAQWGDTITIRGRNFFNSNADLKVFIDAEQTDIISEFTQNDTILQVCLPRSISAIKSLLSVEMSEKKNTFVGDTLNLIVPIINDFFPKITTWLDTISVKGFFPIYREFDYRITLNEIPANIIYKSLSEIKFQVPQYFLSINSVISIDINTISILSKDSLSLKIPKVHDFYPKLATWLDTITIKGDFPNFHPFNYSVKIGIFTAEITERFESYIKAVVPPQLNMVNSNVFIVVNNLSVSNQDYFSLKPPIIESISPLEACFGEIIIIKGRFFKANSTNVKIGNHQGIVNEVLGDSIVHAINSDYIYNPGSYSVGVSVLGQEANSNQNISYVRPEISNVEPYEAAYLDTITILGNFYRDQVYQLRIDYKLAEVIESNPNFIRTIVPTNITRKYPDIHISMSCGVAFKQMAFKVKEPVVSSFSKYEGRKGDTIVIFGNFFNPNQNQQRINLGSIIAATKEKIVFRVGDVTSDMKNVYLNRLLSDEEPILIEDNFTCIAPYKELSGQRYISNFGFSFSINGKGYAGGGTYSYGIYEYSKEMNRWDYLGDLFDWYFFAPAYFVINDKAYIVCGTTSALSLGHCKNTVREFNPATNTISIKNVFPGGPRYGSFSFSINGKGYIGGGRTDYYVYTDFWVYDPELDNWVQKSDFPGGQSIGAPSFVINNRAYVLYNNELWCYSPEYDSWERKADFPGQKRYSSSSFAIGVNGYIANGSPYFGCYQLGGYNFFKDLWEYNSETDNWTSKTSYPGKPSSGGANFVINGKAYFGFGITDDTYYWNSQFFEYDPSLDQ